MRAAADESSTGRHIPALDGVRGLAIAAVLGLHLFVRNSRPEGGLPVRAVTSVLATGWVGVELFFVLSGFLITGILYDTRTTPNFFRNFYARRAIRIFPLYYGFLLTAVAVSLLQGYHWNPIGLAKYLLYIINLFPDWYSDTPWLNINHFWSLCVEEQFYLVWPALVYALKTPRRIAAFAVAGSLFSLALRIYEFASGLTQTHPYISATATPSCLDSLFTGALLAILMRSRFRVALLQLAPRLLTLLILFWIGILARFGALEPIQSAWIDTVGVALLNITFASLVASVLRYGGVASRIFSTWPLRQLGRYSYGLYVYHYSVHQVVDAGMWNYVHTRTSSKILPILAAGGATAIVSLVIAVLSFHLFEQPILRLKNRFAAHGGQPKLRREVELANQG